MKKYEYKTTVTETKGMLGGKVNVDEFNQHLNQLGNEGWELVTTTPSTIFRGATAYLICVFKREIL